MKLGDFVGVITTDKSRYIAAILCGQKRILVSSIGIIVYDHSEQVIDGLYTVKNMKDGHFTNYNADELHVLTAYQFCTTWCKEQIQY